MIYRRPLTAVRCSTLTLILIIILPRRAKCVTGYPTDYDASERYESGVHVMEPLKRRADSENAADNWKVIVFDVSQNLI
jgi:hypothetical protein